MVLRHDLGNRQSLFTLNDSTQRSPPQELKFLSKSVEMEQKKINLPTITVIESSPIREYPPQDSFAATLAHTTMHSSPSHALAESHPLPMASEDLAEEAKPNSPTIEALIKATKGTFSKEDFKTKTALLVKAEDKLSDTSNDQSMEEIGKYSENEKEKEDTNNNAPSKPKPSDLPPLKTLIITCPSSPLLQRHAKMQAQKETGCSESSPTVKHRNSPSKRSPPMFRTSLTEISNKSKGADGTGGSLSPKLSRRFSGQGGSMLGSRSRSSSSLDSKDGNLSPVLSSKAAVESEKLDTKMEVGGILFDETVLDMTVQSGMVDSNNLKKSEKKNVTFALEGDNCSISSQFSSKSSIVDADMTDEIVKSVPISVTKSNEQSKPIAKERKKKGPLGIVMGKAAIAARAVSSGTQKTVSSTSVKLTSPSKSTSKPERKHSHGQCVMGTSVAHSNRSGHVSCATCGRRRAASQTAVTSEPPLKQQAKGKQTPIRKSSVGKSSDAIKGSSLRDESTVTKLQSKKPKPERKPFFV